MAAPIFSLNDITSALQKLCPRGRVWNNDPDSTQTAFWKAIAGTFKRQADACNSLLADSPPFNLNQMLTEWEETLGLPDPCAGDNQTIQQRVAHVISKLSLTGGQSVAYFIALAQSLGFLNVSITNYAPFRAGRSDCGDPVGGPDWFFTWLVNAPNLPVSYFQCGDSHAGDPLYQILNGVLKCTIEEYAPAHTNVLFSSYT